MLTPPPPFPYFFKVTLDNLLSGSCSVWLRFKVLTLSAFISSFFCNILTNIPKTNIQNHQQSHDTTHSKTLHVERYRTKKLNNAKKKNRSITWVEILFEPNQLATIITTFDKIQWKFGFQLCCDSVYGTFW